MKMKSLLKLKAELVGNLRKQSAGYGFVTDESIKLFEEQFVIPALTLYGKAVMNQADNLISEKLAEFANTPLDQRQNGWEWLLKLRASLKSQLDK